MAHKGHLAKHERWEQRNQDIIKEIVIIKCEEKVTREVVANKSQCKTLWLSTTVPVDSPNEILIKTVLVLLNHVFSYLYLYVFYLYLCLLTTIFWLQVCLNDLWKLNIENRFSLWASIKSVVAMVFCIFSWISQGISEVVPWLKGGLQSYAY